MDPVNSPETQDGYSVCEGYDITSWVSVCPSGLWKVQQTLKQRRPSQQTFSTGNDTSWSSGDWPKMGSLCKIRVHLTDLTEKDFQLPDNGSKELTSESDKPITEQTQENVMSSLRSKNSVLQVPLGDWATLRLGEGECDVMEACLERMRAQEKCEILLSPMANVPAVAVKQASGDKHIFSATVELHSFTPGRESWEMSPSEKLEWVQLHKRKGGVRFRSEDLWGAADSYSRALKLLITLHAHAMVVKEMDTNRSDCPQTTTPPDFPVLSPGEYKTMKAELHSNLSLCQLKLSQPEQARANAAAATQLEPSAPKAWYRLGQACRMVNEWEEARRAFRRLQELQPESPLALKALKDVTSREKETNSQLGQRLSKMFS